MSKETSDTLGNQKRSNYALSDMSKEAFITELTTGILPAPQYFAKNAALNKSGYTNYSEVLASGMKSMNAEAFEALMDSKKPIVLDVRKPADFAAGHIPGALFIGIDGQFAPWVGTLIHDIHTPILLITPEGREEETVMRLSRVGYDNCMGYLEGGMTAWTKAGKKTEQEKSITPEAFMAQYEQGAATLDVRKPGEFEGGHLQQAQSCPLDFISEWMATTDKSKPYMVHCAGGYRSMIAISILKANGFKDLTDVQGGYGAISKLEQAKPMIVTDGIKA